jgi:exopolysaccharide biosynthesis polyprenyl glycosylphosphotransferase
MDPIPGEVMSEPASETAAGTATRERRHWARPEPRVLPDASPLHLERRTDVRLQLQRRAPANLRHHFRRGVVRLAVLVVADVASFGVMRALMRAARDYGVAGNALAGWLEAMLPPGILNGWQYAAALFVGLLVTGNYGQGDQRHDPRRLFLGAALATALPLWMTVWTRGLEPVLVQYGLVTVLVWIGLVLERRTINRVVAWLRPPERDRMDVLFVGPGADCVEAIRMPAFSAGTDYRPIGFLDTEAQVQPIPGALGRLSDLPRALAASGARAVVISGYLTEQQFRDVVDAALAGGCQVLSVPRSVQIAGVHPTTVWRRGQPLVELTAPSLKEWQLVAKRAMDIAGAALGLVLLSPVFAVVAALVKLESPGPIFFKQERVGSGGRRFRIIKFRTMVDGADQRRDELLSRSLYNDARLFKIPNDPRMTRLGRWLRRTSLDELPQLVNVLRGAMSLVGPRPPLPSEVELYEAHHYARFDVKPGMTGPWQVAGRNGVTAFDDVIALETSYIRNWSVWADMQLLLRTVPVVVRMDGAF